MSKDYKIAVIGGGPAGLAAASALAELDLSVDLFDREVRTGGKLWGYHQLFPARNGAGEILEEISDWSKSGRINRKLGKTVTAVKKSGRNYELSAENESVGGYDAVVVSTGFDFFDARMKEEFGYGIYPRVITSPDLENRLKQGTQSLTAEGQPPASVAFVHCVGSRDEQVGIPYCSKLCCITGIKQAIEVKEAFPEARVFNFYIDMRAFGSGYEELYRKAQEEYGVRFIRGRVSEAAQDEAGRIRLKAEDTLMSRPIKLTVDWLVLLVGMVPSCTGLDLGTVNGRIRFLHADGHPLLQGFSEMPGVFAAGCCTTPMSIPESVQSGHSAAFQVWNYLKSV